MICHILLNAFPSIEKASVSFYTIKKSMNGNRRETGMNKRFDVTALGELLIDFTESGISEQGNPILEANPGGAPCNVLAMLTKLGRSTAFIGKVEIIVIYCIFNKTTICL